MFDNMPAGLPTSTAVLDQFSAFCDQYPTCSTLPNCMVYFRAFLIHKAGFTSAKTDLYMKRAEWPL